MTRERKLPRRQIFVLTPEEKRTVAFILFAILLGLAAKHYRGAHPPAPVKIDGKHSSALDSGRKAGSRF
jgi:hypothetical protein